MLTQVQNRAKTISRFFIVQCSRFFQFCGYFELKIVGSLKEQISLLGECL